MPFKYYFLLGILLRTSLVFAQCEAILPFNEKAMHEIHDVYQFQFLNKTPKNKLDSLVFQIMYPSIITDSNYFDWSLNTERVQQVVDRVKLNKLIHDLGKLKTPEAFLILNLPYLEPFKVIEDLSPFNSFLSNIRYYGGAVALNANFLNAKVSTKLNITQFETQVVSLCKPLYSKYFKHISYCRPLQGEARALYEMSLTQPSTYDAEIERVIQNYLNKNERIKSYYSLDSILIDVLKLPTTVDAQWDNCYPKVSADNFESYNRLGVMICVGEDQFHQKKFIQRVYTIRNHTYNGQILWDKPKFDVDFISRTRKLCNGEE